MLIDTHSQFSVAQAINGAAVASTDFIDAGENGRLLGPGRPMYVVVAPVTVNAATTVTIQTDDDDQFGSPTTIGSVVVPTNGRGVFSIGFPYSNERYIRVVYNGDGTFTTHLTDQEPASWKPYPAPSQA